jgi:hypothetical protein
LQNDHRWLDATERNCYKPNRRISADFNELSGRAKDCASGLVFAAFFGAGICRAANLFGLVRDRFLAAAGAWVAGLPSGGHLSPLDAGAANRG